MQSALTPNEALSANSCGWLLTYSLPGLSGWLKLADVYGRISYSSIQLRHAR